MDQKHENRFSMFLTVKEVLEENISHLSEVRKLAEAFTSFSGKVSSIQNLAAEQKENLKGITQDKQHARVNMANLALKIAGAVIAYADDNNNNELKRNVDFSLSELIYGRDTLSKSRCMKILAKATANILVLSDYGITPADLGALEGSIATYSLLLGKPRTAKSIAKAAGAQMLIAFDDADRILKQKIDKLMLHFKGLAASPVPPPSAATGADSAGAVSPPPVILPVVDLYTEYINAREVIDRASTLCTL